MNKERYNQIIDEVYENYLRNCLDRKWMKENFFYDGSSNHHLYLREEFINKCKTDPKFSEKWGLKIEERDLSLEKRHQLALPIWKEKYGPLADMMVPTNVDNTPFKIPTKLITLTYNNETIESYE